jgi:hypothetical protein
MNRAQSEDHRKHLGPLSGIQDATLKGERVRIIETESLYPAQKGPSAKARLAVESAH